MPNQPLHDVAFGAPVPGQSLTDTPKNNPWEHPPQFVDMKKAMHYLMDQMTEPENTKQMLQLMEGGMPIEAIVRTVLFTGFATGKWTVDVAIMLYKPLMLSLISMANRAGLKDTPVLMPQAVSNKKKQDLNMFNMVNAAKQQKQPPAMPEPVAPTQGVGMGFMQKKEV